MCACAMRALCVRGECTEEHPYVGCEHRQVELHAFPRLEAGVEDRALLLAHQGMETEPPVGDDCAVVM